MCIWVSYASQKIIVYISITNKTRNVFVINMDCDSCQVDNELIRLLKIRYLCIKFFLDSVNILFLLLSLNWCGIRNVVTDWKMLVQFTSKHSSNPHTFFQKRVEAYPPTSSLIYTGLFHITLCTGYKISGSYIDSSIVCRMTGPWPPQGAIECFLFLFPASFVFLRAIQYQLTCYFSSSHHFYPFLYLSFNNIV